MMKKYFLSLASLVLPILLMAQITNENFENTSESITHFTSNGQVFNITSITPTAGFSCFGASNYGWNGTSYDAKYISNDNNVMQSPGNPHTLRFSIGTNNSNTFKLKSLWLFLADHTYTTHNANGNVTIEGSLAGIQKFTITVTDGFNHSYISPSNRGTNNGYTLFNMASISTTSPNTGANNYSNILIDKFTITTTNTYEYICLDAMTWDNGLCTPPSITSHPPNRAICAGANTTFAVTASNATNYQWQVNTGSGFNNVNNGGVYSGATSATLSINGATTAMNNYQYRCVATGFCTPTSTSSAATLTVSNITATTSKTDVSCNGLSNGSATVSPSGGVGSYTYSWAPSGGTAATASGLSVNTYTCTITDNIGCNIQKQVTITQPSPLTSGIAATNVSCNAGANGTAAVIPSGGISPYSYSWAPSGGTAATATGLSAGSYTCTITDANNCQITKSINVTQPSAITSAISATNVSCYSGSNGTATVSPSGGIVGYTYTWAPSGGTAAIATGLSAGNYICTITDANLCRITKSISVTQPSAITLNTSKSDVSFCNGSDGAATITASGGTPSYIYSWSPSGGNNATASGLAAGTYTCTVTDGNTCTKSVQVTLTSPPLNGTVLYVDSTAGNDANNGTSWAAAFKTLSFALNAVRSSACYANMDSILVAKGTYYPTGVQSSTNRDSTFLITKGGLKLLGGYPSGGGIRNSATHATVLSGNIGTTNVNTDNSYHVMVVANIPANADSLIIDGFTIAGANGNGSGNNTFNGQPTSQVSGGGIRFKNNNQMPKMVVSNCIVRDNRVNFAGGGILCESTPMLIVNTLFYNNHSGNIGGALHNNSSSTKVINCTFYGNEASNNGGVVYNENATNCTITNSILWATIGNGLFINNTSPATIDVSYSNVMGGISGINNINDDPLFVNPLVGNFNLKSCSPSIDVGSNSSIPSGINNDLANAPRVYNSTVDMGAYELQEMPSLPDYDTIAQTICNNDSALFSGNWYHDAGYYTDTFQSVLGCDSIVTLDLTVNPASPVTNLEATTCSNVPYSFGGENLIESGIYNDTLQNVNGCDSVITLNLTVNPTSPITNIETSTCANVPYIIGGEELSESGIYNVTLQNVNGCDSVVVLDLTVNPTSPITNIEISTCANTPYSFGGENLTQSGIYNDTLQNANGCDSVITLNLTVTPFVLPSNQTTIVTLPQEAFSDILYVTTNCELVASLSSSEDLGNVTITETFLGNAQAYNDEYYVGRFYDIEAESNVGADVFLYFTQQDFDDYNNLVGANNPDFPQISANGSNLLITAFHSEQGSGNGPQGYDTTGAEAILPSVYWNAVAMRYEVSFHVNHFSGFFAHTNNTGKPLPIKMGDISAVNLGATNRVNWNTISEQQGESFEIERANDGKSFDRIGMLNANGVNNSRYNFVDANPYDGINFYRLKIINNDNTYYYSKVVNAVVKTDFDMAAYPNPVKDELKVTITGTIADNGNIILADVTGRILQQDTVSNNGKLAVFSMKGLATGAYFVTFKDGQHNKTIKVVKE